MSIDWRPLDAELEHWGEGAPLPLWWRDDDAVTTTPALDRLTRLADQVGMPIHLAVIPAGMDSRLATHLKANADRLIPLVHGWEHANHAPETAKKAEFPANRSLESMAADIRSGHARLSEKLGFAPAPMFVPPWNRVAPDLPPLLPELGFSMISTYGPRATTTAAPGLTWVNTHADPIDWRGSRSAVDPTTLIHAVAAQLADCRAGRADATEPYGLLTHHLVHDAAIWDLTEALMKRLAGPHRRVWTANEETNNEPT